jgi:hypothetical protein
LLCSSCEAAALRVGEAKPLSSQLFAERPILGFQVLDSLGLLALDPAGTARDQIRQKATPLPHAPKVAAAGMAVNSVYSGRLSFRTIRGPPF